MEKVTPGKSGHKSLRYASPKPQEAGKNSQKNSDHFSSMTSGFFWLSDIIKHRTNPEKKDSKVTFEKISKVPEFGHSSPLGKLMLAHQMSDQEKLLTLLCFTAQFKPQLLDSFLLGNPQTKMRYREYGGVVDNTDGKFIPTLQTIVYLIAGNDDALAAYTYEKIKDSKLFLEQIINFKQVKPGFSHPLHQIIEMDLAYYNYLVSGKRPRYDEAENFPAELLSTEKSFDDLVLKPSVFQHLESPMNFVRHYDTLFGNNSKIRPGYLVMLYGPPGTGKSLTVAVMGKHLGIDVYSVNLSRVVSKYIGETEKNLERVFQRLVDKRCILFFDEADALFGKRTDVKDAKDRYANQEVAYLLQKIEQFPGLVILASNFRQNLDDAFKRRILTSIMIPPPDKELRLQLWEKALPEGFRYEPDTLPETLASRHTLTGANITNIIKLACIEAVSNGSTVLDNTAIEPFVKLELLKEGKNMTSNRPVAQQV